MVEQNKDVPPAHTAKDVPVKDTPGKVTVLDKGDRATDKTADQPSYAKTDPRSRTDLGPGESRLVASGAPVPDGPKLPTVDEQAERRDAGIPEPPVPGPGSDMYLTAAGYTTVPAGVDPNEPVVVRDSRMDARQYESAPAKDQRRP